MEIKQQTETKNVLIVDQDEMYALHTTSNILEKLLLTSCAADFKKDYSKQDKLLRETISNIIGKGYADEFCLDILNIDSYRCMLFLISFLAASAIEVQK